jgi:DNA-binding MarR family transcriptional regulator
VTAGSPGERPLTDPEYASLADFRNALRSFLSFSEGAARDHGLTAAQHQLLLVVRGAEARRVSLTMSDLAEQLQLRLHSAGELVARAVDNGLLVREPDPGDRRRVLVATSPEGRRRLEALSVLHRRELRRFRQEMYRLLEPIEG